MAAALDRDAYLVATYFAQGAFKELFEIALLVGFALWLGSCAGSATPDQGPAYLGRFSRPAPSMPTALPASAGSSGRS